MNAPIIVSALLGAEDFAWADGLRRAYFPAERNLIPAHLTLFHHLPPSVGPELDRRLSMAARLPRPGARYAGLVNLGGGVALRIESAGLAEIRAELADAFADVLIPQDRAGWRPHITIQNKVPAGQARALLQRLEAGLRPRALAIAGLASWWYRGGPWEQRSRFPFRA